MSVTKQIVEPLLSFVTKVSSTLFLGYLEVKGNMPRVDNDLAVSIHKYRIDLRN